MCAAQEKLVTPDMVRAGARVLRESNLGDNLEEVATDVFYAMQAAAQATKASASRMTDS
jgi:hypothetical protein